MLTPPPSQGSRCSHVLTQLCRFQIKAGFNSAKAWVELLPKSLSSAQRSLSSGEQSFAEPCTNITSWGWLTLSVALPQYQ